MPWRRPGRLLLQAVEYDDSRDTTAFGFSDMAPYSYQLALSMREDWMYFYLYPSSNGPIYVLPYLGRGGQRGRPRGYPAQRHHSSASPSRHPVRLLAARASCVGVKIS